MSPRSPARASPLPSASSRRSQTPPGPSSRSTSTAIIYYGLIVVVEIHFFAFLLPKLLREHMEKFDDPTRVRRFPYATRLPRSATFFLASWHEELQGTRIGRYCLGEAVDDDKYFDGSSHAIERIHADETWAPSPAVRISVGLLSGLAVLPATLQEVAFEEVFTFAPILSALVLEPLQRGGDDDKHGRRNYDVAVAVNIVGIVVVLLVAYGLYRLVATVLDRACATRRRVDADDYDRDSWVDAVKSTVVKRTFKGAVKRVVATVRERKVVQGATTGEPDAPVDHASVSDAKGRASKLVQLGSSVGHGTPRGGGRAARGIELRHVVRECDVDVDDEEAFEVAANPLRRAEAV